MRNDVINESKRKIALIDSNREKQIAFITRDEGWERSLADNERHN